MDEDSTEPDSEEEISKRSHVHKHVPRAELETRRWHRSCFRKAGKTCTKACSKAFKLVCKKRKCSKRFKKVMKKECRKSCVKNFEFDKERPGYEE